MTVKNLLSDLPDDLRAEVFQTLAASPSVTVERIVSLGHTTPADQWYDQDRTEWVTVLAGSGTILFEADARTVTLNVGEHLLIRPHQRHRVVATDPTTPTIWLAVHFS
jgi:cupin 2 domain-containing protein